MSLGLVVLEKKLFTRTRTPTPQSDDIKSRMVCFNQEEKVAGLMSEVCPCQWPSCNHQWSKSTCLGLGTGI